MARLTRIALAAAVLAAFPTLAVAGDGHDHRAPPASGVPPAADAKQERCAEHGVQKSLCTRCNPKLAAVYKAKGDWCPEHARPETQCVLCHPELAKKGVK